jgi:hypothetical protein
MAGSSDSPLTEQELQAAEQHIAQVARREASRVTRYRVEMQDHMRNTGQMVWVPHKTLDTLPEAEVYLEALIGAWRHVRVWRIVSVTEETVFEHVEADNREWERARP